MPGHVLVTGAAGFIGSNLCDALLATGTHVIGLDAFTSAYAPARKRDHIAGLLSHPHFRLIDASLATVDIDALLEGVTHVFHLAAQAGVRTSWGADFTDHVAHNLVATQRLCEALRRHAGVRLVYSSSSSVYGQTARLPMSEDHPTRPESPYGVTKLAAEALCLVYARNYAIPTVCLRYFTVYGPRQRPDMAMHRFITAALRREPVDVYGNGEQTRDFTFVSDAVAANLAAARYRGDETVFNIGGGSRVTVNTVLDRIGRVTGRGLDVRYQSPQPGDVTHTYADITRAAGELHWSPAVELEAGLERHVEWVDAFERRGAGSGGRA